MRREKGKGTHTKWRSRRRRRRRETNDRSLAKGSFFFLFLIVPVLVIEDCTVHTVVRLLPSSATKKKKNERKIAVQKREKTADPIVRRCGGLATAVDALGTHKNMEEEEEVGHSSFTGRSSSTKDLFLLLDRRRHHRR